MAKWILPALLFLSPPLSYAASDEWGTADSVLLGANLVAYTIDARQTMMARREYRPNGEPLYVERNSFLGEHPDDQRIRNYFAGVALTHAAISYLLPRPYRSIFQVGALTVSIASIRHNYEIGIRFNF